MWPSQGLSSVLCQRTKSTRAELLLGWLFFPFLPKPRGWARQWSYGCHQMTKQFWRLKNKGISNSYRLMNYALNSFKRSVLQNICYYWVDAGGINQSLDFLHQLGTPDFKCSPSFLSSATHAIKYYTCFYRRRSFKVPNRYKNGSWFNLLMSTQAACILLTFPIPGSPFSCSAVPSSTNKSRRWMQWDAKNASNDGNTKQKWH